MKLRRIYSKALPILKTLGASLVAWKIVCVIAGTAYALMVVSSESLEASLHRGDLIFLWNRRQRIHTGDIPVVWFDARPLPMVHRAIRVIERGVDGVSQSEYVLRSPFLSV